MLLFSLACAVGGAGDFYDPETWNSPLASEAEAEGDAGDGETIFYEETWNGSAYGLTCSSCHSVDPGDTLTTDADEYNRAGHTVWNVAWRENWKQKDWDDLESTVIGAFGGQICVVAYYPDSTMDAQSAADLEAFLRTQKDDTYDPEDPRSNPLDYGFTSWDADAWWATVEAPYGDATHGEELTTRHCGSCHSDPPVFYSLDSLDDATLMQRIRKAKLDDVSAPNGDMPRLPHDRLSDEDLADVLAYLTQPAEE